jgi:hypothetical protein
MLDYFKKKWAVARSSTVFWFNTVSASISTFVHAFPDFSARTLRAWSEALPSLQPIADPAILAIIGKGIALLAITSIVLRVTHLKGFPDAPKDSKDPVEAPAPSVDPQK